MSIRAAVSEIEKEIARLSGIRDSLLSSVDAISSSQKTPSKQASQPKKKATKGLSKATRDKIAESQRKRWAEKQKLQKK